MLMMHYEFVISNIKIISIIEVVTPLTRLCSAVQIKNVLSCRFSNADMISILIGRALNGI